MTDEKLISLTADYDERAFEALLSRYERLAYNIAYRKVRNTEDAKEIVWAAFLKLWHNAKKYRGDGNASAYIYTIVKNCAADLLRRREQNVPLSAVDGDGNETELPIADPDDTPEEKVLRDDTIQTVRDAIDELPPIYREVLLLCDIEGKSYAETAELLSLDMGTVKSRLSRARKNLKKILGDGNKGG